MTTRALNKLLGMLGILLLGTVISTALALEPPVTRDKAINFARDKITDKLGLRPEVIKFDIAEDATRFVFDEAPVDEGSKLPLYGNPFVTQGYIYPPGTLGPSNGVLATGEPEFPELVIGEWTCRGWFVGDGALSTTGHGSSLLRSTIWAINPAVRCW